MKFRSKNKEVIRLTSTRGDIIRVGKDWVDVPEHMEGDAYAAGCLSEEQYAAFQDMQAPPAADPDPDSNEPDPGLGNVAIITEQINNMIDEPQDGDFTNGGLPNLIILSSKCGFTVTKPQMEEIWTNVSGERDKADGDE